MWLPFVVVIGVLALLTGGPILVGARVRAVRSTIIDVVDPARLHAMGLTGAIAEEMFAIAVSHEADRARTERRVHEARQDEAAHAVALDSLVGSLGPAVAEPLGRYRTAAAIWHRHAAGAVEAAASRAELDAARDAGLIALDAARDLTRALESIYVAGRREVRRIERADILLPALMAPLAGVACLILVRTGRSAVRVAVRAELDRMSLARTTEERSSLLRGISHDLQSSLSAALGNLDLILHGVPPSPDQSSALARIRLLLTDATNTIPRLLSVARAATTEVVLERRRIGVDDIVRVAVDEHAATAQAKEQLLRYEDGGPCIVQADPEAVRRIVDNLLSNASKYAPRGADIRVAVQRRDATGQRWCTVTVADTGPGIPRSSASRVFEDFYRVPEYRNVAGGLGIGLAVSRRMARLMDGDLTLDHAAEVGNETGARFTLWLPALSDVT